MVELSTSFSDVVLALSAYHCSYQLSTTSYCGFIGFLLLGFAASAGAVRFAMWNPSRDLVAIHTYLSWIASILGMSCLAAAYHRQALMYSFANGHLAVAIAMILLSSLLADNILHYLSEAVSSGAVVSLLVLSIIKFIPFGVIGSVLYAIAGLLVGTRGHWMWLPRVDWFHYMLAIGNIALMMGLNSKESPLFYAPPDVTP